MQNPNVYFQLKSSCQLQKGFHISQLFSTSTGLVVVLEVYNRDAKIVSWSTHVVRFIGPHPFTNIEFED